MKFKTSTDIIVTGERLYKALGEVATEQAVNALGIRLEDGYADHVTKEQKEKYLKEGLILSGEIIRGEHNNKFWCWQRINYQLTGNSIPFLRGG